MGLEVQPSAAKYQELLIDNQWQLGQTKGKLFNFKKVGGRLDIGLPLSTVLGGLWSRDIKRMCTDTLERGISSTQILDHVHQNSTLALSLRCTPSIKNGSISGLTLRIQDVTAWRRLAHQQDLRDKMKMIAQLASHIGHKMNNPIATVLNKIGGILIEDTGTFSAASLRRDMQHIQEQLYNISLITTGLAAFSNGSGKEHKLVQINDVLQNALHLMSLLDSHHKIRFQTELMEHVPRVLGSEVTLEQCIVNICKNSVEAMPDGGDIHIKTTIDEQFPDFINITISDDGPGIRAEDQHHVFEPFFTTKKAHHGLGLCVSFAVASSHDGGIELWSQEGVGTTVHILLPIATVELDRGSSV